MPSSKGGEALGGEYPSPPNEERKDCSAADIWRNESARVTLAAYDWPCEGGGWEGTKWSENNSQSQCAKGTPKTKRILLKWARQIELDKHRERSAAEEMSCALFCLSGRICTARVSPANDAAQESRRLLVPAPNPCRYSARVARSRLRHPSGSLPVDEDRLRVQYRPIHGEQKYKGRGRHDYEKARSAILLHFNSVKLPMVTSRKTIICQINSLPGNEGRTLAHETLKFFACRSNCRPWSITVGEMSAPCLAWGIHTTRHRRGRMLGNMLLPSFFFPTES